MTDMGASYVAVPAQAIEDFLVGMKFERTIQREEVVYQRRSTRNPDVMMKVFTSIRTGRSAVRACGKDSIKVAVVFETPRKSFGIGKFPPVFRVASIESVLRRLRERLMDASKRANEWIDGQAKRDEEFRARRTSSLPKDLPGAGPLAPRKASVHKDEWLDRMQEKADFARSERDQEERAFRAGMEADLSGIIPMETNGRRLPPFGSFAAVAHMLAESGLMTGEEADEWKDAQKDASMDEPPSSAFMEE